MPSVKDVIKEKGGEVQTIDSCASVVDAAVCMNDKRIGALIVMQEGKIAGIFTERDLMTRITAAKKDPAQVKVGEVMTTQVRVCSPDTLLEECRAAMTRHKIRHLPVVEEGGKLVGMLSIGDIMARVITTHEDTIRFLHEYMHGPN